MSENKKQTYLEREKDWRNGAIVYQVIVDRFAPAINIESKRHQYDYPKVLKNWSETPKPGQYDPNTRYHTHELEYWGGDLNSLYSRLDYIKSLGVDVLYLNPIVKSLSNHKYDASDYMEISPEYGTKEELKRLTDTLHQSGRKLILDGVFNHVGINSDLFQNAKDSKNPKHKWFDFNDKYPEGVRLWADVRSLPELNLENPEVQEYIYKGNDSVIKSYLRNGIDGWRLDVAFDIGYEYLKGITDSAHEEKPGSVIIGEIWNYPQKWLKSIDGVMNFTFREIIIRVLKGDISPNQANLFFNNVIESAGIESILKSWNLLDNHDVPRLKNLFKEQNDRKLAQVLQFTLPGSPNLYYGTELGMDGANDPMNRAPMRWDMLSESNPELVWTKKLVNMHKNERALKVGDYIPILSDKLIGFERKTDRVNDTVIVLINPTDKVVSDTILMPDSDLMSYTKFEYLLGNPVDTHFVAGFLNITLEPKSFIVVKPLTKVLKSYTAYKRI